MKDDNDNAVQPATELQNQVIGNFVDSLNDFLRDGMNSLPADKRAMVTNALVTANANLQFAIRMGPGGVACVVTLSGADDDAREILFGFSVGPRDNRLPN